MGVPSSEGGAFALRDSGTFTTAGDLDATDAREVLALFAGAPRAGGCDAVASSLVVARWIGAGTDDGSVDVTVELDGCQRMAGPELKALAAPEALRALLQP